MRTLVSAEILKVKLISLSALLASFFLAAIHTPISSAQVSNLLPSRNSTVSVRELGIPSSARDEFERGLRRLQKRDPAGSLQHFEAAIKKFPGYYEAYYDEAVAKLYLGRDDEALQLFQTAIDLSSGRYVRAEFGYALVLCRQGNPAKAERIARRGLEADPGIPDGYVILGLALLGLNHVDEAEQAAQQGLQLNRPEGAKAYLVLADIHAARKQYEAQARDLTEYLKQFPDDCRKNLLKSERDMAARLAARTAADPEMSRDTLAEK